MRPEVIGEKFHCTIFTIDSRNLESMVKMVQWDFSLIVKLVHEALSY
jgi:hypothetical protein